MSIKPTAFFITFISFFLSEKPIKAQDSLIVSAKIWSKDEAKKVHYSDWQNFASITIDQLKGFHASDVTPLDKYAGLIDKDYKSSGFFRTEKINNRWNVINPLGHITYVAAVNAIRTSKTSPLPAKYKDVADWTTQTIAMLQNMSFNVAGCWSDVDAIIQYNASEKKPMPYTIQLNLLGGYFSETKKSNSDRKGQSILGFILDDNFSNYCNEHASKLIATNNDPNLFGIFSDNEIAFTNGELKELLSKKDTNDQAYLFFQQWMKQKSVDENTITNEQKQAFIGAIAQKYYSIVSAAIKKFDKNHMYIGSRIHSNAKNNPYIFSAANPYIDIISINYYGDWQPKQNYIDEWAKWSDKPFFITEFYTKAEETGMNNMSGAGWIVKTHKDRGIHYQNFCLQLLKAKNCVGWHWFRYQDNDPNDTKADDSNKDSNKGIVNIQYETYQELANKMKQLNMNVYGLIQFFDNKK